ncbi:MAG: 23S rRNA (guanosine(2251)-2'-O)-methyltransferase RlmB [Rhodoplanes sp.]
MSTREPRTYSPMPDELPRPPWARKVLPNHVNASMPDRNPPDKPPRRSPPRWRSHSAKFAGQAQPRGTGKGRASAWFGRGERFGRGEDEGPAILYGWHTVLAALENPARRFHRLLATENAARRLAEAGVALPRTPEVVRPDAIAALVGPEAVHQGLYAETDPLPSPAIEDLDPHGVVLVFDQITDPHNVGAILRSAAAFGVAAVVVTTRHSPAATGVLAKAASGALDYVPIVTVGNLARALTTLKERGFLTVGLDSAGETDLADLDLAAPLALVLGAEGKGLRQLTRTTCDRVARLDLPGRIKSLNVSNATALALYIATRRLAATR